MRLFIRGVSKLHSIEKTLLSTMAEEIGVRVHPKDDMIACDFDSYRQEVELMGLLVDFDGISWSPHDWQSN